MSRFKKLEGLVLGWAVDRGIMLKSNPIAQMSKTFEEVAELNTAIIKGDRDGIKDGFGDVFVTLIIGAELQGLNLLDCLEYAYDVISKRKGQMINGMFVKDTTKKEG